MGRAVPSLAGNYELAPGAALRLSTRGLIVSAAETLFRITSGVSAVDGEVYARLGGAPQGETEATSPSGAALTILATLARRGALTSLADSARPPGRVSAAPIPSFWKQGTLAVAVGDATDARLTAWACSVDRRGQEWSMLWMTPSSVAVARCVEGQGCAACSLFFDGELARGALPDRDCGSSWLFSRALVALAAARLPTVLAMSSTELPDHHAWYIDLSTLRTAVEPVPFLPGCSCSPSLRLPNRSPSGFGDVGRRFAPTHAATPDESGGRHHRVLYRGSRSLAHADRTAFGVGVAAGSSARVRAEAEAIERFCMMHAPPDVPQGSQPPSTARFWSEGAIARHLFSGPQYNTVGFRFAPFAVDVRRDWSWAHRLEADERSVERALIPTSLVGPVADPVTRLADATSSGYAAHPVRAVAVARALLELVERDALLCSWISGTSPIQLDGACLADGYEAYVVPSSVDLPVVLVARRVRSGGVRLASAAGSSLCEAVAGALAELAIDHAPLPARRGAQPVDEISARNGPADHVRLYEEWDNGQSPVLTWLGGAKRRSYASEEQRWPTSPPPEAGGPATLTLVRGALSAAGFEAWIVDRSLPALFSGWHVVRALVPGFVEMSWGRHYLRVGGHRGLAVCAGREAGEVTPHPFG